VTRARQVAFEFLNGDSDLNRREAAALLDETERGMFLELVAGVKRRRITLDRIAGAYFAPTVKKVQPEVRTALQLGLYQMLVLGVPHWAAINETVELLSAAGKGSRGFVNGVLRSVSRGTTGTSGTQGADARSWNVSAEQTVVFDREVFPDPQADLRAWMACHYGFSGEAVSLLEDSCSADVLEQLLVNANTPPLVTIRPNSMKGDLVSLQADLEELGIDTRLVDDACDVLVWLTRGDPTRCPLFDAGRFAIQGFFASQASSLLGPQSGEKILDVCAPPGGKSCQMASSMTGGNVVALALDETGEQKIRDNAARLGVKGLEVRRFDGQPGNLPRDDWDAILLDVPCSNTGVLSRRPEARFRLNHKSIESLQDLQTRLLHGALKALSGGKSGSRLVYSTCSILPCEGSLLVRSVLKRNPRFRLAGEISGLPLSPYRDGGYAARIEFVASAV